MIGNKVEKIINDIQKCNMTIGEFEELLKILNDIKSITDIFRK